MSQLLPLIITPLLVILSVSILIYLIYMETDEITKKIESKLSIVMFTFCGMGIAFLTTTFVCDCIILLTE